jgi:hypothetical protein
VEESRQKMMLGNCFIRAEEVQAIRKQVSISGTEFSTVYLKGGAQIEVGNAFDEVMKIFSSETSSARHIIVETE